MKGGGCVFARDSSAAWGCPSGAWLKVLPPSSVQLVGVQARALLLLVLLPLGVELLPLPFPESPPCSSSAEASFCPTAE